MEKPLVKVYSERPSDFLIFKEQDSDVYVYIDNPNAPSPKRIKFTLDDIDLDVYQPVMRISNSHGSVEIKFTGDTDLNNEIALRALRISLVENHSDPLYVDVCRSLKRAQYHFKSVAKSLGKSGSSSK